MLLNIYEAIPEKKRIHTCLIKTKNLKSTGSSNLILPKSKFSNLSDHNKQPNKLKMWKGFQEE